MCSLAALEQRAARKARTRRRTRSSEARQRWRAIAGGRLDAAAGGGGFVRAELHILPHGPPDPYSTGPKTATGLLTVAKLRF